MDDPTGDTQAGNTGENVGISTNIHMNDNNEIGGDGNEEQKESSKSLLKNHDESSEIIVITKNFPENEDTSAVNETPTLPIALKKGRGREQVENKTEERPSIITAPFVRMKYDWEHSQNLMEFFIRVISVFFVSIGWIVLVGGIPFLSIAQLIIGSIFINDCPADHRIPEYLIVAGVFGTILHGVSLFTKYAPTFVSETGKKLLKVNKRRCVCIECILQIFLFIWFIAGCTWVYSIYEPDYINKDRDEYCHKGLYLFSFWMFNITFIILLLLVTFVICAIAIITFDKSTS